MPKINGVVYGYCGILCSLCKAYLSNQCPGCDIHVDRCLYASCAIQKNVKSCLSCSIFPCRLHIEGFDWNTEEFGRVRWKVFSGIFIDVFKKLVKE
jgi:hypothetical protein